MGIMNKEEIDKWLDNEYGVSYTRLEELHDFYFEKYCDLREENKQLKDNWNKLKEWIETTNTWYDNELGIVDMKGYNTNRVPIVYKNSLLFEMQELEDK